MRSEGENGAPPHGSSSANGQAAMPLAKALACPELANLEAAYLTGWGNDPEYLAPSLYGPLVLRFASTKTFSTISLSDGELASLRIRAESLEPVAAAAYALDHGKFFLDHPSPLGRLNPRWPVWLGWLGRQQDH